MKGNVLFNAEVCLRMFKAEIACEMCAQCAEITDKIMCRMDFIDALSSAYDVFMASEQAEDKDAVIVCGTYMQNIIGICGSCTMHSSLACAYIREKTKRADIDKEKQGTRGKVIKLKSAE